MQFLVSLGELRDGFIIVYGTLGIIFFLVGIFVTLMLGFTVRGLIRQVKTLLDESVRPTMSSIQDTAASIKDTADTVRGTTEFVGRTAVTPVVKTYGTIAGIRKGFGVLGSIKDRGNKS